MEWVRFSSGRVRRLLCVLGLALLLCAFLSGRRCGVRLPVLMYHHIGEGTSDMTVSPERFEEQMAALAENGWHSVTIPQLTAFVDHGVPLPSKPVLITFDDGYASNLEFAAPVLERYGMSAVIFVIGINAGRDTYLHTGEPLLPERFALEDAAVLCDSGVLEIQSHTFDLHQLDRYGISGRNGVLPLPGEPEEDYRRVLAEDFRKEQALFAGHLGTAVTALAYPFGLCCDGAEEVFSGLGVRVTFTTTPGINRIRRNAPETLHRLCRYTITDRMAAGDLLWLLKKD